MSGPAIGALVRYCGHDGYFLADIHSVGNVNIVRAAAQRVDAGMLTRPADGATHHLLDFPRAGFWRPELGVFVVPREQVKRLRGEEEELELTEYLDGLEEVLGQYLPWSFRTFPRSTPLSVALHLEKEVSKELKPDPSNPEEIADVVLLAVHLARRAGVDLVAALRDKFSVIQGREWQEPNEHGFQEHVKGRSRSRREVAGA